MKLRNFLVVVLLFGAAFGFAQENGLKGYYIDNLNNRVEVQFKYIDIKDNGFIEIRKEETQEYSKIDVATIKEYGVGTDFKFIRATVSLDVTASRLSMNKEPKMENVTVFLNAILEGKASLYSYNDGAITRFFFISESNPLTQLIYKKYQSAITEPIRENTYFRNQIFEKLTCKDIDVTMINALRYNKADLTGFFKKYNECNDSPVNIFENTTARKSKFRLTAFAGAYNSTLSFDNMSRKSSSENEIMPAVGIEFATRLPSGKIEFFFKAEYEHLNATAVLITYPTIFVAYDHVNYNSGILNFSVGPRYNFLVKDQSNFFADLALNYSLPMADFTSTLSYPDAPQSRDTTQKLKADTFLNFSLGLGYNFNRKMGLALSYQFSSDMLNQQVMYYQTKHSRLGLAFRYTIL